MDASKEINRIISYLKSCIYANIDCTITIDKKLTQGVLEYMEEHQSSYHNTASNISKNTMDAVEFLKNKAKMCEACYAYTFDCVNCPLSCRNNNVSLSCTTFMDKYPEHAVQIVKEYMDAHPSKTRQSELLKIFPNIELSSGVIPITPCIMDPTIKPERCDSYTSCDDCIKEYWTEEVG